MRKIPIFIYQNHDLIYRNEAAKDITINTDLLDNFLSGALVLGEMLVETELSCFNLNGLTFYFNIHGDKHILGITNDRETFDEVVKDLKT